MKWYVVFSLVLALSLVITPAAMAQPARQDGGEAIDYVVVYAKGVSIDQARQAVQAVGGEIVKENAAVGVATVRSTNPDFMAAVAGQPALLGATRNQPVGQIEPGKPVRDPEVETLIPDADVAVGPQVAPLAPQVVNVEPLTPLQWDMAMIAADAAGSYATQQGDPRVIVAIIDSGIDGSHPDLAPNLNVALSRNFVTDMPDIDGPCEFAGCVDPPDWDDSGHGTHVAGTVAAAINGLGVSGVAPKVTLVNARGGQDSGYVFLQPVVDALVYAGDIGADVANMSFYIDPWLYNCANNPADSPAAQAEQRAIIEATQRAVDYARAHGVTLIAALGNEHTDLGNPTSDDTSPDYPPGTSYPRVVDNSCIDVPTESNGVISVSALGPTKTKADYSNYGTEQTDVSAPGGYFRDYLGTPQYRTNENLILSTYPQNVLEADGLLDTDGTPLTSSVIRDCQGGVCAYYAYLQGTSMASPHAVGVAAVIVSQFGSMDSPVKRGLTLLPRKVERILKDTAKDTPCPDPPLLDYTPVGRPPSYTALCVGDAKFNGFYGNGIVNAFNASRNRPGGK